MPKYLFRGSYNQQGVTNLTRDGGSGRAAVAKELAEKAGGNLEFFSFAFGTADFYALADLPDHVAALKVAASVGMSGSFSGFETIVLVSPEEMDAATEGNME